MIFSVCLVVDKFSKSFAQLKDFLMTVKRWRQQLSCDNKNSCYKTAASYIRNRSPHIYN